MNFEICSQKIGKDEPCFIIAEAGINHNGKLDLAKKLIDIAVEAGADAVKFQTFHAENVVTRTADKAEYQKILTSSDESQFLMIKNLELPDNQFLELLKYANLKGIIFFSTPFDEESVDLLDRIGVPLFKISSGEITNFPLMKKIAGKGKPIILSTGMSTLGEIEEAISYLKKNGANRIILLHCSTCYPAPLHSVNLRAMDTLRFAFHLPVGYSDHTEGITISVAAVAMGAQAIEKHITLDKNLPGPDHRSSLEPREFSSMVRAIRDVELALGSGMKKISDEEREIKKVARRSIVAKIDIGAGDSLQEDSLSVKRPGTGIEPKYLNSVLNMRAKKSIHKDQVITWDMIE